MSKVKLRGVVQSVSEIQAKNEYKVQRVIVKVSEFDRNTGEPLKEQSFEVSVFNDRIEKIGASRFINKKVDVDCYLNGSVVTKEGKEFHNLYLTAASIAEVK